MRKKIYLVFLYVGLLEIICSFSYNGCTVAASNVQSGLMSDTAKFVLRKGDILARPNWSGMPGSSKVENGKKSGHVAIVTAEASGKTPEEALEKAMVIEALFFDQATRKLQFRRENQIRETTAAVSFGQRFKGIRYRLRMNLTDEQTDQVIQFMQSQLDRGYSLLSLKKRFTVKDHKESVSRKLRNANWNCATLVWEAFFLSVGIDIDSNKGLPVFPSDIITSKYFDNPGGRVCF